MRKYSFYPTLFLFIAIVIIPQCDLNAQHEETIELEKFNSIEIIGRIDTKLVLSKENKLELSYEGIDRDKIKINNEDEVLKIKIISTLSYKNIRVLIKLCYEDILKIGAYSSATIFSEETVVTDSIFLKAESGGEITLKIFADTISSICSTGGIISLAGKTNVQIAKVSSGGTISAVKLESDKCNITASSKGIAKVNAINEFYGKATSGGYISYKGTPAKITIDESLKGKIDQVNY